MSHPNPAHGGSRGCPTHARIGKLNWVANSDVPAFASASSIWHWQNCIEPCQMTGNKQKASLCGSDQIFLCFCLLARPDAEADEIATFTFDQGGTLHNQKTITKQCLELQIMCKQASTEVHQAFLPQNILRVEWFWTLPPPLGVVGTHRRQFIDVDEFGVALQRVNTGMGRAHISLGVRKPGHCCRNMKSTALVAVKPGDNHISDGLRGSIANPR